MFRGLIWLNRAVYYAVASRIVAATALLSRQLAHIILMKKEGTYY